MSRPTPQQPDAIAIALPDTAELDTRTVSLHEQAAALALRTPDQYAQAGAMLTGCRALLAEIDATFSPVTRAAHATWKASIAARDKHAAPVEAAKALIAGKMSAWTDAEEERRHAREAKARAEAEAVARAERDRLEAEARARAAAAKADGDKAAAAAARAEAAAIKAAPVVVAPVVVESRRPVVEGIRVRHTYSADCHDIRATVAAAAAGDAAALSVLTYDQTAANRLAGSLRELLATPGVRCVVRTIMG